MTSSPPTSTSSRKPTPSPPSLRQQPSFWERTKQLSDKIGGWSNKQANRAGVEAFYPTSLDDESNKAARILRTFTWDAADLPEESLADRRKSQIVLRKIPPEAIHSSSGLAIFTVFRTGLLHSVAAGSGVVLSRLPDGSEFSIPLPYFASFPPDFDFFCSLKQLGLLLPVSYCTQSVSVSSLVSM